jgi:hypothetical protein
MGRAAAGGAGTPGGSSGQIQVNDGAGGFGGLASSGTGNAVRVTGPTMTNPIVGTQTAGDNSTKAASTAYVDSALAGVVQVLEGEVATFADLPAAGAGNNGHSYLVRQSTGVYFVNRKKAGIYTSDGAAWALDGDATEAYFQDTLAWSNITSKPADASQAEAEAGTEVAIRAWSPVRVKQAIDALGGGGGAIGYQTYATQVGFQAASSYTTAITLPINGGSIAVPVIVVGNMKLIGISYGNRDTANAHTLEWRLYTDPNASPSNEVSGANGTFSFTPSAASVEASTCATPVSLAPGVYWIVLRNTNATVTAGVGSAAGGSFTPNAAATKTLGSALGATLDLATSWAKTTSIVAIRLNGAIQGAASSY